MLFPFRLYSQKEFPSQQNILGFDRVQALAQYLMQFGETTSIISQQQAGEIVGLWNNLEKYNKTIKQGEVQVGNKILIESRSWREGIIFFC